MTKTTINEYKIWAALLVVLLLLFLSGRFLFKNHLQHEIEIVSEELKDSRNLISMLIKERLQKRSYYETRNFILNWGASSPEIVEIILSTKNGFKLAHFQRPQTTTHELVEKADIAYSYTGVASLTIRRSLGDVYQTKKTFFTQFLSVYFLIALVLFLLVYIIIRTHKQKQQLNHLANHDSLTKLPNRLLLSDRLNQTLKYAHRNNKKVAILFIDLDNFKRVNDSLGHSVGDIILKEAAQRLHHCIRETDSVARLGGDEFTIIINDVKDNDIVTEIAIKIIHGLQEKFHVQGHDLFVTTSIGISIYPDDAISSEELLRNADAAMYKAKDGGRNTYRYYTDDMTQKAFEHILMESSLRLALEHNELIVYYQPQVNGKNNQIIGMEALVRLQHPELGIVSPAQFIPLAEKAGLIIQLGEQVFDIATKQMATWMKDHQLPGRMAINLSGKQFQQTQLVETLSDKLQINGCRPEWIELEITENHVMSDPEKAITILQKFQDMGIEISIDDFGTGYSSLSYLKRLPINKLKVDQSFVRDISDDEDDRVIITSTISLAKNMNLNVIAEGVETKEQKEFLLKQGCNLIQGYYYSRPVSDLEMTELLKSVDWKNL